MTSGPFTDILEVPPVEDLTIDTFPPPSTEPPLLDTFNSFFDTYSIPLSSFTVPDHCATYIPDNDHDGSCRLIITPEPTMGAKQWTFRGKWITIGVYRDEGRPTSYDNNNNLVNFYEDYVVFRLLPSFRLIPVSIVNELLNNSGPSVSLSHRSMVEITTGNTMRVTGTISKDTNYHSANNPSVDNSSMLARRFNQLYDERGEPLQLSYDALGYAIQSSLVDSKYKNNPVKLNPPSDGRSSDLRIFVYDYYGVDLNDPNRGPYFRSDLIQRSGLGNINNIKYQTGADGQPLYSGGLYDHFGNIVVGIQSNNALAVRQPVMPLTIDQFNHPIKSPLTNRVS